MADRHPKILGLIGARGGSKGLKDKNVLDFAGKPLIAWTIDAALGSRCITDVVVSTDSERIREAAIDAGARAPFRRPSELAEDSSDINDAVIHCIEWLRREEENEFDYVCLLQPTQPLRTSQLIDTLIGDFLADSQNAGDTFVTVTKADTKAAYLMCADQGFVEYALNANPSANRQDMPAYYLPAGVLYLAPVAVYERTRSFYGERTRFAVVDSLIATDIDNCEDFDRALRALEQR